MVSRSLVLACATGMLLVGAQAMRPAIVQLAPAVGFDGIFVDLFRWRRLLVITGGRISLVFGHGSVGTVETGLFGGEFFETTLIFFLEVFLEVRHSFRRVLPRPPLRSV